MNLSCQLSPLSQFALVSWIGLVFIRPIGISRGAAAQEVEEKLEDEVRTRGVRGKASPSRSRVMKNLMPSIQPSVEDGKQQIQALQRQVKTLQAQVNVLRAVIQVSNGTTTVQSKHIRIQGDSVTVKSFKGGVTIGSKKDFRIKSKRRMIVKASAQIDLEAEANLKLKGGALTSIRGAIIKLNNGGKPVARLGSTTTPPPGGGSGGVTSGSPTVLVS